jgi:hypothetical protein
MVIPTLVVLTYEKEPPQTSTFSFFLPWLDQYHHPGRSPSDTPTKDGVPRVSHPTCAITGVCGDRKTVVEGRRDYE